MPSSETDDLMVLASWMYYEERLTQEEIAEQLGISRVGVTRMLQRARQEGVVRITITRPLPAEYELQVRLKKQFDLKSVTVVASSSTRRDVLEALGKAGAELVRRLIFPNCRLGMAWSSTVSFMAPYLEKPNPPIPLTVNELAGTFLTPSTPYGISWRMAEKLGAALESLPVPVLVQNSEAYAAILKEDRIRLGLQHAAQVDLAVVGLGNIAPDCTLVRAGYMTVDQVAALHEQGIVGDILMRFYDEQGNWVPTPGDERIIALQWEQICRIPHIVAIVAGPEKIVPLRGALRGRFIHSLITDVDTARGVLEMS